MKDITPNLLKTIQADFNKYFEANEKIKMLYEKVKNKNATYREAHAFAIEVGECLVNALGVITSEVLPDGHMYYNIAEKLLNTTLKYNYDLITDVTTQIQKVLNERANIGLKAIKPKVNQKNIDSIINKITSVQNYDEVAWMSKAPIVTFSLSIVDDAIKDNMEFQFAAGLSPIIIRTASAGCCEWCKQRAGVYDYEKVHNKGNEVFRRHNDCRCLVDFNPQDGRNSVQNVHNKRWRDIDEKEAQRQRIESAKIFKEQQNASKTERVERLKRMGAYNHDSIMRKLR